MSDHLDDLLLDRYLADECTAAERSQVDRWLAADVSRPALIERLRAFRSVKRASGPVWDKHAMWDALRSQIEVRGARAEPSLRAAGPRRTVRIAQPFLRQRRTWTYRALGVAAAMVVVALGALLVSGRLPMQRSPDAIERVVRAGRGQVTTVQLIDGSRVTLAAGSTLEVPRSFGRQRRDVVLHGQAYFDVAHDRSRPFRVHSRNAVTQVLGTKFAVRAYHDDSTVSVVVAEGLVALSPADSAAGAVAAPLTAARVLLAHGDAAQLDAHGHLSVEHGVDVARRLGWVRGRLAFVNAPLADVVRDVERWYDAEIVITDSAFARTPVTVSFDNDPLGEMMDLLASSLDARVEQDGRVIRVIPRR
jgi:transmembrane sensor